MKRSLRAGPHRRTAEEMTGSICPLAPGMSNLRFKRWRGKVSSPMITGCMIESSSSMDLGGKDEYARVRLVNFGEIRNR